LRNRYVKEIETTDSYGNDLSIRPEALAACVIAELRKVCCKKHQKKNLWEVRDVTITVPTEWTFLQRQATAFAARVAGFYNVRTLQEPVAAYLCLIQEKREELRENKDVKNILVFDFGGGTCDISVIVKESPDKLPFVLSGSMVERGGEQIDAYIAPYIQSSQLDKVWEHADTEERMNLVEIAKMLKERIYPRSPNDPPLSAASITLPESIYVAGEPISEFSLERGVVAKAVEQLLPDFEGALDQALERAQLDCPKIDRVLMVGGSSYLREVQTFIRGYFNERGKSFSFDDTGIILHRCEEAVAFGAAMHQLDRTRRRESIRSSLSLETFILYQKEDGQWDEHILGNRGQPLPIPNIRPFFRPLLRPLLKFWVYDVLPLPRGQDRIEWYVYQRRIPKKEGDPINKIVEEVKISGYKPGHATQLRLSYIVDEDGNLTQWEPYLVNARKFPVKTKERPETSLYDFSEDDIPKIREKMQIDLTFESGG
jgi:molecular chaperone DnaK (HSP70)